MSARERTLTQERLQTLLEAYGAELSRMPEEEREAVRALLARSTEARTLLEEARALDARLAPLAGTELSPALLQKLDAIPRVHAQEGALGTLVPLRARRWTALAAAAALLLGVFSGLGAEPASEVAENDSVEAGDPEEFALADLGSLALGEELLSDLETAEGESE